LSKENLFEILLDPRVIQFAREVLGSERIIYWGDSSYQIGTGTRGFHRDCVDKHDLSRPDWRSPYSLIRIGFYLQDHSNHSGGLKVKPGTHERLIGPSVFVDTKPGDLVAWNLKLLHSGNAVKLKWFSSFSIDHPTIENQVPLFLRKEQERERMSMFITFASESSHLYRYISEYQLKRKDTLESLKASAYSQRSLVLAEQRGVDVRVLLPKYQLK
jgi:ectoine hydroxylase-related dioxygenase (phytanoyl-CoA dioxygenase family)